MATLTCLRSRHQLATLFSYKAVASPDFLNVILGYISSICIDLKDTKIFAGSVKLPTTPRKNFPKGCQNGDQFFSDMNALTTEKNREKRSFWIESECILLPFNVHTTTFVFLYLPGLLMDSERVVSHKNEKKSFILNPEKRRKKGIGNA